MRKIIANISVFIAFVALCGLGIWQLQRLEYKNNLINSLKVQLKLEAENITDPNDKSKLYRNVTICGKYLNQHNMLVYSKPNYIVLTPFYISEGNIVLAARGTVNDGHLLPQNESNACITGILMPSEKVPLFMPECDGSKNRPMLSINREKAISISGLELANSYLLVTKSNNSEDKLLSPMKILNPDKIYNSHLEYAITWFILAGVLVIMFLYKRK